MGGHGEKGKKGGGGKGKGKGKGGKSSGAPKGKGKPFIPPGSKRFAFGRRGQGQGSTTSSSTSARSTTRGSTASQSEIQEVQAACLGNQGGAGRCEHGGGDRDDLDVHSKITDESNYNDADAGWAIMDSGATRTVCGTRVWDKLAEYVVMRDLMHLVDTVNEVRDFRFGDGVILRSQSSMVIPVCVAKQWTKLKIHILPGTTPLLLARPDLEK